MTLNSNDILFEQAADILENGAEVPDRVTNKLLAGMLKHTHAEARDAKREAREAKTLAQTVQGQFETLDRVVKIRVGLIGGFSALGGAIVAAIVLASRMGGL